MRYPDFCRFVAATTGTNDIVATAAEAGFRTPPIAYDGETLTYAIVNKAVPSETEAGKGVWTFSAQTLSRVAGNVRYGSAGIGVLTPFSAGEKLIVITVGEADFDVFQSPPAASIDGATDAGLDLLTATDPETQRTFLGVAPPLTDSEIAIAYSNIVALVEQAEAESGVSQIVRRWTSEMVRANAAAAIASLTDGRLTTVNDPTNYSVTPFEISAANNHEGTTLEVERRNQSRRLTASGTQFVRFSLNNLEAGDYGQIINETGEPFTALAGAGVDLFGNGSISSGQTMSYIVQFKDPAGAEVYILGPGDETAGGDGNTLWQGADFASGGTYTVDPDNDRNYWLKVAGPTGGALTANMTVALAPTDTSWQIGANGMVRKVDSSAFTVTVSGFDASGTGTRVLRSQGDFVVWRMVSTDAASGPGPGGALIDDQLFLRKASTAEAQAGTDTTSYMTAAATAAAITALGGGGGGGGGALDGGTFNPAAINLSGSPTKYDKLTITQPTATFAVSTPGASGEAIVTITFTQTCTITWSGNWIPANRASTLITSLAAGTYDFYIDWVPDADGIGQHRNRVLIVGLTDVPTHQQPFSSITGPFLTDQGTITGSAAAVPSGRSLAVTGNVTAIPVSAGWQATFRNSSGTNRSLSPASGQCIRTKDGTRAGSVTLANDKAVSVEADGTNLWVYGDVV